MKKPVVRRQVSNEEGRRKDERLFPLLADLKIHLFPAKRALRYADPRARRKGMGPAPPVVLLCPSCLEIGMMVAQSGGE